jgi:hypothetical protein
MEQESNSESSESRLDRIERELKLLAEFHVVFREEQQRFLDRLLRGESNESP